MPSATTYGLFVLAALLLLVIPGPAVLYIVSRSLDQGRAAGLASDATYAVLAGVIGERLRSSRFQRWFGGTVLVGLGIAAAAVSRPTSSR